MGDRASLEENCSLKTCENIQVYLFSFSQKKHLKLENWRDLSLLPFAKTVVFICGMNGATTFSMMTLGIRTPKITTLLIMTIGISTIGITQSA